MCWIVIAIPASVPYSLRPRAVLYDFDILLIACFLAGAFWAAKFRAPLYLFTWYGCFAAFPFIIKCLDYYSRVGAFHVQDWHIVAQYCVLAIVFGIACRAIAMTRYELRDQRERPERLSDPKCKTCGYLLIGLTEPRCPECATGFDVALLTGDQVPTD
jgi:hypothetical protein